MTPTAQDFHTYPQQRAEDIYLYHCYLYYVCHAPRISDHVFDLMHAFYLSMYPRSQILASVGSDSPDSYPAYIREFRRPYAGERRH